MKFDYIRAEDYCKSVRDGTHDTPKPTEHGYKLVTGKHVKNGRIDPTDAYYISEQDYRKINERSLVEQWDVLMSMIGTVGEVAVVKNVPDYAIKNVALFKCGGSELKGKWLSYYLQSPIAKGHMNGNQKGSSQQFLSLKQLRDLPVIIIDKFLMQRIVNILSSYDDLIENNRKQIKLLEEAAQRLYKEWFVDLRFPGYEDTPIIDGVPEGWKKVPVGNLISYEIGGGWGEETPTGKCIREAYVIRGTDLYGIAHGDLLSIPFRYHVESNLSSRKLKDGDIVFEVSGGSRTEGVARCLLITSSMLNVWKKDVMCASFCKLIRPQFGFSQYLYDCIKHLRATGKTEEYDKRSASSIVNYRWKDFLSQELVLRPSEEFLDHYNGVAKEIYSKAINCSLQIESAKKARDRLLPKLISGEIEV